MGKNDENNEISLKEIVLSKMNADKITHGENINEACVIGLGDSKLFACAEQYSRSYWYFKEFKHQYLCLQNAMLAYFANKLHEQCKNNHPLLLENEKQSIS